jgi:uncharacterized 2Fe-2S/4Fe-4S cluster protein (DUF4445 family)
MALTKGQRAYTERFITVESTDQGIRVLTRDGDELDGLHIVMAAPEDVISLTPMEMDLHYGTLVPLGTAKIGTKDL